MKKIFLTSGLMMCVVMPTMAVPTNTSNTFPNDELMQADYTYTNQATYENTGVYSDSVDAEANYEWNDITVPAGKYLRAGETTVRNCPYNYYCPGLAQPVHYDAQNDQGAISCSTVGDGTYVFSEPDSISSGVTPNTQGVCHRYCDMANMGTSIPNYPHATILQGPDYYGTTNETCLVYACEAGYHVGGNNTCEANIITINWNGATASAISANNAGTTVYGGDIRTPQSYDPSQVPAGKRFVGWKFSKPVGFNLSTLDASIDGTSFGFQCDSTGAQGADSSNTSDYGLTSDQTWGVTFNYGKIRGEARCSDTNNGTNNGLVGNPGNATTGGHCWCKATGYQATGSSEWQNVLPSGWVYYGDISNYDCAYNCAYDCAFYVKQGDFRRSMYGLY